MSFSISRDIGDIYTRLYDPKPFLQSEIDSFVKEFELKRKDREIENIFSALQHTIEIRDSGLKRCSSLSQTHLPAIVAVVANAHSTCQETLERVNKLDSTIAAQAQQLAQRRARRDKLWQQFVADVAHKQSRIDNTFEEKEEELRELYTDLANKLHIHI